MERVHFWKPAVELATVRVLIWDQRCLSLFPARPLHIWPHKERLFTYSFGVGTAPLSVLALKEIHKLKVKTQNATGQVFISPFQLFLCRSRICVWCSLEAAAQVPLLFTERQQGYMLNMYVMGCVKTLISTKGVIVQEHVLKSYFYICINLALRLSNLSHPSWHICLMVASCFM